MTVTPGYHVAGLRADGGAVDPEVLRPGVSLTLFKDELLDLTARDALEVFFVEMGTSS
jgi:hypothetical protein